MKGTYRRQVDTNNASKSAPDGIRACARGCMCAEVSIAGRRDSSPELAQSCWHPILLASYQVPSGWLTHIAAGVR